MDRFSETLTAAAALLCLAAQTVPVSAADPLRPVVEVEETVYAYTPANNGAGPLWCSGSTSLARVGDRLFATGLETLPDLPPLNNCRWSLYERKTDGWEKIYVDTGRTREPSPIATFHDGRVFVSANPTLLTKPEPGGGPARPDVLEFHGPPWTGKPLEPVWDGTPHFTEHSYRSFAADGAAGELVLFQNIDYTHAEWCCRDRDGNWSARGRLKWPWGAEYEKPQPIRVCYPNVALVNRAVHFFGVSDIVEPNPRWREFKRQLTGREWDYDFRRLFYTWTPDIGSTPFTNWVEIASREATCGWVSPGDLWVAPSGEVHLLWTERALDERLREKFLPDARQSHSLRYAVLRDGKVLRRQTLVESSAEKPGPVPSAARFQVTPQNRLLVCFYASGTEPGSGTISENRLIELRPDATVSAPVRVPLQKPFTSYFTATVRAGSRPSSTLEMLGQQAGFENTIRYARVRLE